jgi:hypothetical protein
MSQAKKRGTFDDRKRQSIERTEADKLKQKELYTNYWNSLTEEQQMEVRDNRRSQLKAQMEIVGMMSLLL